MLEETGKGQLNKVEALARAHPERLLQKGAVTVPAKRRFLNASPNRQRWLAIGKEHDNFSAHTASECLEERSWDKTVEELENMFSELETSRRLLGMLGHPWFADDLGVEGAYYKGGYAQPQVGWADSAGRRARAAEIDLRAFSTLDKVKTEKCNELDEAVRQRPAPGGP